MRLIDAGKLEQALVEERNNIPLTVPCAPYELMNCKLNRAGQFQRSGIRKALRVLSKQPTVDAVKVVHGRWVQCFEDWRKQMGGDECSLCGFQIYGSVSYFKYCPHCGAKMDGDVNV